MFEIRQPERPDRYPIFSQGCIAAAGVEKSKSVAYNLGDATISPTAEKAANDGCSVSLKSQQHLPPIALRPIKPKMAVRTFPGHDGSITSAIAAALLWTHAYCSTPQQRHTELFLLDCATATV